MATAGSKQGRRGSSKPAPADQAEFDPKFEWQENASSSILRNHLSGKGFTKQDIRVQVDGAGRLKVRGQRSDAAAAANATHSRPLQQDGITARFEAGVLI